MKADLRSGKKNDVLKALTIYEAKSARRNPAYLIYGYIMSFIVSSVFDSKEDTIFPLLYYLDQAFFSSLPRGQFVGNGPDTLIMMPDLINSPENNIEPFLIFSSLPDIGADPFFFDQ